MDAPEFLGPYRLGETLGRGGMGSVYAGVHERSGERVAVKLIAEHVADEMRFRRRFDAEIETLRRLQHEGIVRLIGYGEEQGQLFYSMELVEGEPLHTRIRRVKRVGWMAAIEIAIQVCAALKHAHDMGIIHRDLKPANLILTKNDKVKLVDFGIAKIFGYGEQTLAGSVLGTADYMAPEQASNEGISPRTDLYALGSVLYAMLAGRPPFKGKRITDVIDSLRRDKPVPLELINPEIPDALVEIVHQLLEKKPENRPPTALAVMNRLKAMRAGLLRDQTLNEEHESTAMKDAPDPAMGHRVSHSTKDKKPADVAPGTVHKVEETRVEGTVASKDLVTESGDSDDFVVAERSTHFQAVADEPSQSGIFGQAESEPGKTFSRVLSIGIMLVILAMGAVLVVVALRKPTADDSYNEIQAIAATGDLSDARPWINRFIKLFPDDPRLSEVQDMKMLLDLNAVIRRLELKRGFPGQTLEPHEETFLDAMDMREIDNVSASEKMEQWLVLFAPTAEDSTADREQMAKLMNHEIGRVGKLGPLVGDNQGAKKLLEKIHSAEKLVKQERRMMLQSIVNLYSEKTWAKPAVDLAREQIRELDGERDPAPVSP